MYSNFLITVNTNKRIDANNDNAFDDFLTRFENALASAFELDGLVDKRILELGTYDRGSRTWEVDEDQMENWRDLIHRDADGNPFITVEIGTEESPNNKGIHAHVLMEVQHYTQVRVNRDALNEYLLATGEIPEVKNNYISISLVRGGMKTILKYIRKNQPISMDDLNKAFAQLKTE